MAGTTNRRRGQLFDREAGARNRSIGSRPRDLAGRGLVVSLGGVGLPGAGLWIVAGRMGPPFQLAGSGAYTYAAVCLLGLSGLVLAPGGFLISGPEHARRAWMRRDSAVAGRRAVRPWHPPGDRRLATRLASSFFSFDLRDSRPGKRSAFRRDRRRVRRADSGGAARCAADQENRADERRHSTRASGRAARTRRRLRPGIVHGTDVRPRLRGRRLQHVGRAGGAGGEKHRPTRPDPGSARSSACQNPPVRTTSSTRLTSCTT